MRVRNDPLGLRFWELGLPIGKRKNHLQQVKLIPVRNTIDSKQVFVRMNPFCCKTDIKLLYFWKQAMPVLEHIKSKLHQSCQVFRESLLSSKRMRIMPLPITDDLNPLTCILIPFL